MRTPPDCYALVTLAGALILGSMGTVIRFPVPVRALRAARARQVFESYRRLEAEEHQRLLFSAWCLAASAIVAGALSVFAAQL